METRGEYALLTPKRRETARSCTSFVEELKATASRPGKLSPSAPGQHRPGAPPG